MSKIKKLALSGMLICMGVVMSAFYIPIGVAKCFPVQHFINVLSAVILGPLYGVLVAFSTALLRNLLGTGSLLAFPGSMIGALCAGLLYKRFQKTTMALVGEVLGTGILGALMAYPIAALLLTKQVALFTFVIPFGLSSLVGAALSLILLKALSKTKPFMIFKRENKSYDL
jgi:energy coupling factor transporter S component ThiW